MRSFTRHTSLIAAALYAAVALLFLAPVLLRGDVVIYGLDTLTEEYPMYWWGWTQIKEMGRVPWWCPHLFGGYPFVASFSFCPFYPPQWLSLLLDFPAAYNWQFFLVLWMAGCCGYSGLRLAGWPRGLALAGGLLWMTCGHVVTLIYPGHLKKMQALVWVPLAWGGVAGALRAFNNPGFIPPLKSSSFLSRLSYFFKLPMGLFVIAGVALAMQLLAHHFQIFYFTVMMVGLYWLWFALIGEKCDCTALQNPSGETSPASRSGLRVKLLWQGGLGLTGAGLIAIGLSAVQMFPSLHMAAMSNRAGGVSFDEATITSYPPEELLEFAMPQFWGDSARRQTQIESNAQTSSIYTIGHWFNWIFPDGARDIPAEASRVYLGRWNSQNPERLVSDYIGIVVILLAGLGLAASKRTERWLWLGLIILSLLIAIGSYTPIFKLLWQVIPMLDRFRSPGTSMFVISWGIIILAIMGMESLMDLLSKDKINNNLIYSIVSLMLLFGMMILICAIIAGKVLKVWDLFSPSPDQLRAIKVLLTTISFGRTAFICLVSTLLLIAMSPYLLDINRKTRAIHLIIGGLVLIQTIDMWDHSRPFVQPEPYTAGYARYLFDTPPDNYLAAQPQPFRMIQFNNELATRFLARGLNSTHGYHPVTFQKYFDILDHTWYYDPLFIHLYHQQYVIAREGEALPEGYVQVAKSGGYQVGRFTKHLNHAWIAQDVTTYVYPTELFKILDKKSVENNFYNMGYISHWDYELAESAIIRFDMDFDLHGMPPVFEAKVTRYDPGRIELSVKANAAAWLFVSEHAAPGWHAKMDNGHTLRPIPVNYFFQMYPAPRGEHTYTLTYHQPLARAGLIATILTIISIAAMVLYSIRKIRNQYINQQPLTTDH